MHKCPQLLKLETLDLLEGFSIPASIPDAGAKTVFSIRNRIRHKRICAHLSRLREPRGEL